ncbi:MAG: MBL fold metallo-hydrolase [Candidatus Omnitrophota bacterium]
MIKPGIKIWIFLSSFLIAIHISSSSLDCSNKDLSVHFIDVGYGDSILIEFPDGGNMLIDGGARRNVRKVIKYLNEREIDKLDIIVATHAHEDHLGGLPAIARIYEIDTVISNEDISKNRNYTTFFRAIKRKKKEVELKVLRRGDRIDRFDTVRIEILHPDKLKDLPNDSSVVIKLTYKRVSFLFAADIGPEICNELVESYGKKLRSNILKVPWHGKAGSEEFIRTIKPKLAIISVGPSEWSAPSEDVLDDYKKLKIPILRTDEAGSIVVKTDGRKFYSSTQRNSIAE